MQQPVQGVVGVRRRRRRRRRKDADAGGLEEGQEPVLAGLALRPLRRRCAERFLRLHAARRTGGRMNVLHVCANKLLGLNKLNWERR
jgi:hypothetical protein